MTTRTLVVGAAAVIGIVASAASLGQTPPPGLPMQAPGGPGPAGPGFGGPFGGPPGTPFPPFLKSMGDRAPSPQNVCLELSAVHAGYFAYLRQRLDLTQAQVLLWRDVEAAVDGAASVARADCAALPAKPEQPAFSQVIAFADKHLAARRESLRRISGPLLKLYDGLSPEQREIMDRAPPPPMIF